MKDDKYRNTILTDVFSESGIKTDVSITIKPSTVPILVISIMVAVVAGIIVANAIQKAIKI